MHFGLLTRLNIPIEKVAPFVELGGGFTSVSIVAFNWSAEGTAGVNWAGMDFGIRFRHLWHGWGGPNHQYATAVLGFRW